MPREAKAGPDGTEHALDDAEEGDPFDGLIAAAELSLDLPLITRDGAIRDWGRLATVR